MNSLSGKRIAIIQSNYIPWKGYFDVLASVDEFILYDDMQYTRRDWRNRNRIKTAQGTQWLTIPVEAKGKYFQKIHETRISEPDWWRIHWATLRHAYGSAPYFAAYRDRFEQAYSSLAGEWSLSRINRALIEVVCELMHIRTKISWSMDYPLSGGKTERLIGLCLAAGGRSYLSGPAAREYMDADQFKAAGIQLCYADYSGYSEYPQLNGPFEHAVTVLDLIFNTGPDARSYLKAPLVQPVGLGGPSR